MPRAVLFDLDNTLHDRDAGLVSFIREQFQVLELGVFGVDEAAWTARFVDLDDGGRVWKDRVYERLIEEFGLPFSVSGLLEQYVQGFAAQVTPRPGLVAGLSTLRDSGRVLGVITNGRTEFQMRTLRALGIEGFFDVCLISEECGFRKPDQAIFELALQRLGLVASEAWYVGDDPIADVDGAVEAGLRAIWFRTPRHRKPEVVHEEASSFEEITKIVLDSPYSSAR